MLRAASQLIPSRPIAFDEPKRQCARGTRQAAIPAARHLRVANFVIDTAAHFAIALILGILVVLLWGEAGVQAVDCVPDIILGMFVQLAYYVVLEGTTSKTLGKVLTRTKVVNEHSGRPTFSQVLIRSLVRLIPLDALTFLDPSARGWHDRSREDLTLSSAARSSTKIVWCVLTEVVHDVQSSTFPRTDCLGPSA